jgi:hypothetical protein
MNLSVWVGVIDNCTWNGFTSVADLVKFASRNLFCKLWRTVWALGYGEESINVCLKEIENEPILEAVRSATAGLLGSRVRTPLRVRVFITFVCCVGSGLCEGLSTRSEDSYRICVFLILCDLETSTLRRPWPDFGFFATEKEMVAGSQSGTKTWITSSRQLCWTLKRTFGFHKQRA